MAKKTVTMSASPNRLRTDTSRRPFPALPMNYSVAVRPTGRRQRSGLLSPQRLRPPPDASKNRPIRPEFLTLFSASEADFMLKDKMDETGYLHQAHITTRSR